jgi:Bacterial SH3 domain
MTFRALTLQNLTLDLGFSVPSAPRRSLVLWMCGLGLLGALGLNAQAQTAPPPAATPGVVAAPPDYPASAPTDAPLVTPITPSFAAPPSVSDKEEQLQVTAPYLELRSGPGQGYPVFYVVERLQWVAVELRRTDWYRVRAIGGQTGWVQRDQLGSTLTTAGGTKTFREVLLDDFLRRRVEFGVAMGRFKSEPLLKFWLQAKLGDAVGVEASIGQVQGVFSGTEFWHVGLTSEPWSDQRFSPFFGIGLGKFSNIPNASQVNNVPVSAKMAQATFGLRWHITERFTARVDTTLFTAFISQARSTEYRSFSAGIGFFF